MYSKIKIIVVFHHSDAAMLQHVKMSASTHNYNSSYFRRFSLPISTIKTTHTKVSIKEYVNTRVFVNLRISRTYGIAEKDEITLTFLSANFCLSAVFLSNS